MDFGLSIKLEGSMTHVSKVFQGTTTHMAPEVLMEGKQSKAADVRVPSLPVPPVQLEPVLVDGMCIL